jgi:hypothetical protein
MDHVNKIHINFYSIDQNSAFFARAFGAKTVPMLFQRLQRHAAMLKNLVLDFSSASHGKVKIIF